MTFFAATLPATEIALSGFDPLFIGLARATLASLASVLLLAATGSRWPRVHTLALFVGGLLLVYGFPVCLGLALRTVPSGQAAVVLAIIPLFTALFAGLWAGERLSRVFLFWAAAGSLSVAAYIALRSGLMVQRGTVWLVAAAASASAGYVISGVLSRTLGGWSVICWMLVLTAPLSVVGTALTWRPAFGEASVEAWAALAFLGLGSMWLGFFFFNRGLALGGVAKVGQTQLLQPFLTILFAALLLGQPVTPAMAGFAALVVLSVAMGRRSAVR